MQILGIIIFTFLNKNAVDWLRGPVSHVSLLIVIAMAIIAQSVLGVNQIYLRGYNVGMSVFLHLWLRILLRY